MKAPLLRKEIELAIRENEVGKLKKIARENENGIELVLNALLDNLERFKDTPLKAIVLLDTVNYFLTRSCDFRERLFHCLSKTLISWYLPMPRKANVILSQSQLRLLSLVNEWSMKFSHSYPAIRLVRSVLESSAGNYMLMPTFEEEEKKRKNKILTIYHQISDFDEMEFERKTMQQCLELIMPSFDQLFNEDSDSETEGIEWESTSNDIPTNIEAHGLGSYSYELQIEIDPSEFKMNEETSAALCQQLKDGMQLISKRYMPLLQEWQHTLQLVKDNEIIPSIQEFHETERKIRYYLSEFQTFQKKYKDLAHKRINTARKTITTIMREEQSTEKEVASTYEGRKSLGKHKRRRINPSVNPKGA